MSARPLRESGAHTRRGPLILEGDRLAGERVGDLARRAGAVTARRGRRPEVALIAFAHESGRPPYIDRKVRACSAVGVTAVPLILPFETTTDAAVAAMVELLESARCDAVFLEFPFPVTVDGDALAAAIPEPLDIDVMTAGRTRRYMAGLDARPPLTVAAGIALLDAYGVAIGGLSAVVVGEATPFSAMFREQLLRYGKAGGCSIVRPDARDLEARAGEAGLVVVAAGKPKHLRASVLAPGAIAIDVGYYNPGGQGDIDASSGIDHLAAFAPVPGGIGPMTISLLVERTIEFAEEAG